MTLATPMWLCAPPAVIPLIVCIIDLTGHYCSAYAMDFLINCADIDFDVVNRIVHRRFHAPTTTFVKFKLLLTFIALLGGYRAVCVEDKGTVAWYLAVIGTVLGTSTVPVAFLLGASPILDAIQDDTTLRDGKMLEVAASWEALEENAITATSLPAALCFLYLTFQR